MVEQPCKVARVHRHFTEIIRKFLVRWKTLIARYAYNSQLWRPQLLQSVWELQLTLPHRQLRSMSAEGGQHAWGK